MRRVVALLSALVLTAALAGCTAASADATAVDTDTVVLDVRTAEEYAAGHLDGAQLLDLNGGAFAAALPGLDPDAAYLVYCRSGNRSGQAVALMQRAGFTDVTDLGPLARAADATGLAVVTE